MQHPAVRRVAFWLPLAVAFVSSLAAYRWADWKWAPAVILAALTALVLWVVGFRIDNGVIRWSDARRGIYVREWRAINALGNCTEHPDQSNFDSFSRSLTKHTDDDVLIGYATILVDLLIAARIGTSPSDKALDRLTLDCQDRWRAVVRQKPARLSIALRAARDYERDGLPHATWDNFRAMAAAAGALRTSRIRATPLRHQVATRYDDYADNYANSTEPR